jgi:hypothetical protein
MVNAPAVATAIVPSETSLVVRLQAEVMQPPIVMLTSVVVTDRRSLQQIDRTVGHHQNAGTDEDISIARVEAGASAADGADRRAFLDRDGPLVSGACSPAGED